IPAKGAPISTNYYTIAFYAPLHIELPQMVVQMFVHAPAPDVRSERAKEGMRMTGALGFAAIVKLPHLPLKLLSLAQKIPLIGDQEFLGSGAVPRGPLVVSDQVLAKGAKQPADEYPLHAELAPRHLHCPSTNLH